MLFYFLLIERVTKRDSSPLVIIIFIYINNKLYFCYHVALSWPEYDYI